MPISIAATGHRPEKLGGHNAETDQRTLETAIDYLYYLKDKYEIKELISGMALGWDTTVAIAAIQLKIPLICAIPFPQQPSKWPIESIAKWKAIKDQATEVHTISPRFSPIAFQTRNTWMVDRAQILLMLWNGSSGGTGNCVLYAQRQIPQPIMINCWEHFQGKK